MTKPWYNNWTALGENQQSPIAEQSIFSEKGSEQRVKSFVLKGQICTSVSMDEIGITENGYLVVEDGLVRGVFRELPGQFAALPLNDRGSCLILPGMTDLHVHAPQFAFRGLGMDMELLEWLNTYTFPEEDRKSVV